MGKYLIRRILQAVPQLFIISIILFVLMYSSGNPLASLGGRQPPRAEDRERLRCQWGLDRPLTEQYLYWLVGNDWKLVGPCVAGGEAVPGTRQGVLRGDFGNSLVTRLPAIRAITERIPNTLILMLTVEVVIIAVSLFIGIYSALRQYSIFDHVMTGCAFITYSLPIFLIALPLVYIFAINFKNWGLPHLPTSGMYDPTIGPTLPEVARHLVLPVMSIALIDIARYSRFTRSTMLEVIHSDYIRTARSKGLREARILFVHAFKNASLPIVTLIGIDLPFLLAGAVVTERIFAWPGMGRLFLDSLERSDFPVLMGLLMMISVAVVIFQLLTDITYTWLDPRIRYS
ncbi:MAG: ABC transporter permease [Anaerolineae bacterium]|nr:ABC transporter permease [Anaerolineae bacterium]